MNQKIRVLPKIFFSKEIYVNGGYNYSIVKIFANSIFFMIIGLIFGLMAFLQKNEFDIFQSISGIIICTTFFLISFGGLGLFNGIVRYYNPYASPRVSGWEQIKGLPLIDQITIVLGLIGSLTFGFIDNPKAKSIFIPIIIFTYIYFFKKKGSNNKNDSTDTTYFLLTLLNKNSSIRNTIITAYANFNILDVNHKSNEGDFILGVTENSIIHYYFSNGWNYQLLEFEKLFSLSIFGIYKHRNESVTQDPNLFFYLGFTENRCIKVILGEKNISYYKFINYFYYCLDYHLTNQKIPKPVIKFESIKIDTNHYSGIINAKKYY
jgi:hypothetical protein